MNKELAQDLTKKRHEYLRKQQKAIGVTLVMGSLALFTLACLRSVLVPTMRDFSWNDHFGDSVAGFQISAVLLLFGGACFGVCYFQVKTAVSAPYVPPVAEQLAALPPEQILVRGSDQPTVSSGELLRAAHNGTGSAAEELLRPEPAGEPMHPTEGKIT